MKNLVRLKGRHVVRSAASAVAVAAVIAGVAGIVAGQGNAASTRGQLRTRERPARPAEGQRDEEQATGSRFA